MAVLARHLYSKRSAVARNCSAVRGLGVRDAARSAPPACGAGRDRLARPDARYGASRAPGRLRFERICSDAQPGLAEAGTAANGHAGIDQVHAGARMPCRCVCRFVDEIGKTGGRDRGTDRLPGRCRDSAGRPLRANRRMRCPVGSPSRPRSLAPIRRPRRGRPGGPGMRCRRWSFPWPLRPARSSSPLRQQRHRQARAGPELRGWRGLVSSPWCCWFACVMRRCAATTGTC